MPIGREVARQVMPEARSDLIDWARYRDDASATVLGVPASIVMPRAGARDPSQTNASMETLVVTMAGYADLLSQALQEMLDELYKKDEDEELADRLFAETDMSPKERKRMFAELESERRYRVKITPPIFASIDELLKLADRGYFDRETEARIICGRAGIPQSNVAVQKPEQLFAVSSQVAIMKATEKQRRQTELEKIDEQAAKKPKTKT